MMEIHWFSFCGLPFCVHTEKDYLFVLSTAEGTMWQMGCTELLTERTFATFKGSHGVNMSFPFQNCI